MSQASDADELFEVTGNELRPVVSDNAGFNTGISFQGRLNDDFNFGLGHRVAQLPMKQRSRATIQDRTQIEEGTSDVDIRDIDVPVLVRLQGLNKAGAFL
jgi:hypothetical protein